MEIGHFLLKTIKIGVGLSMGWLKKNGRMTKKIGQENRDCQTGLCGMPETVRQKNGRSYAEYFARSPSVRCVVFDSDAGQLIEKKARVLARALKTVAMPVSSVTSLENYQDD